METKGGNLDGFPIENYQKSNAKIETAQDFARQHLIHALTRMGYSIRSFEEAWGQLVAIQAEIAADPDNGSKATSAIKFVADAIGISEQPKKLGDEKQPNFPDLSVEDAEILLAWLKNNPLIQATKFPQKE